MVHGTLFIPSRSVECLKCEQEPVMFKVAFQARDSRVAMRSVNCNHQRAANREQYSVLSTLTLCPHSDSWPTRGIFGQKLS
jgi:hypothetical protein